MGYLMKRILGKNEIECITQDLYWHGLSYIKEVYRNMCYVNTLYNDIKLKIDRKDCELWVDDHLPRFICSIDFINNLNINILSLSFSEYDALNLLDFICTFLDSNEAVVNMPFDCIADIQSKYSISIYRIDNGIQLTVFQHSIYNPSNPFPKITIYFNDDNIYDLLYAFYFSWFIDIDNGDISLMESLYSKIIDQV